MVYATPTGKKYHSHPHNDGDYSETTLDDALARGLEPCKNVINNNKAYRRLI
ncbi:hypothetical protein [Floricoccus penangensis]|uniref:hypothetical protein n=1 Tax=Floricoccus penangensis TaxID=1859475 RepID=UPI00204040E7|nr:hypothetical protein [Floricoccus penangensis]URZ87216.1 hypothetical protein KIW23_09070 [Floricoccus penangensis]